MIASMGSLSPTPLPPPPSSRNPVSRRRDGVFAFCCMLTARVGRSLLWALKVQIKEPLMGVLFGDPKIGYYLTILVTTPAPTVLPPSRIAKLRPCSIAIGASRVTLKVTVSPGITSSLSAGSSTSPVTSVVRK